MKIMLKNPKEFTESIYRLGLSKSDVANMSGVSKAFFIQITNGERSVSPAVAKKIYDSLKLTFDDVFEFVYDK